MADFETRSGVVYCTTEWGGWYQTVQDVNIEVNLEQGTKGKEVKVDISPTRIECIVRGVTIFKGSLYEKIVEDDSTWTIEDRKLLRILLTKSRKEGYWRSLLQNFYQPDPLTLDKIRKKLDLERYQVEHPGFDFSSASLDKSYEDEAEAAVSRMDDLQHLGAAALPTLSIGDNKTDDEKLLESQPLTGTGAVITDDEKEQEPPESAAHGQAAAVVVATPPSDELPSTPARSPLNPSDDDIRRSSDGSTTTVTSTAATTSVQPVVTDDMKTEQNESLETDEEKSGL